MTQKPEPDAGVTLIEFIIYILLASLALVAVSMILINSWRTQETVLSQTEATNRGQLVSSAMERAVRNALAIEVIGGSTLRVHTSLPGGAACQGFSLGGASARMEQNAGPLGTTWPEWQDGIATIPGALPGDALLSADGGTVTYAFEIGTDDAPARFVGTVSARNPTGVTSPCWP